MREEKREKGKLSQSEVYRVFKQLGIETEDKRNKFNFTRDYIHEHDEEELNSETHLSDNTEISFRDS